MIANTDYCRELNQLKQEQEILNTELANLLHNKVVDQWRVQTLKKRKNILQSRIAILADRVVDDIIA